MPFLFSPFKGITRIIFSSIIVISCISCQIFTQSASLLVLIQSILEGPDSLSDAIALYMFNDFVVFFYFCLFPDYEYIIFLSQTLLSKVFLIRTLSTSFLDLFLSVCLKSLIRAFICCFFLAQIPSASASYDVHYLMFLFSVF